MPQYADDIGAFIRNLIRGGGDDPLFDADFIRGLPENQQRLLAQDNLGGILADGVGRQPVLPNAGEMITTPVDLGYRRPTLGPNTTTQGVVVPGPTEMIPAPLRGVTGPRQQRLTGPAMDDDIIDAEFIVQPNYRRGSGNVGPRGMSVIDPVPSRSYLPEAGVAATAAALAATAEALRQRGMAPTTPDALAEEASPMPMGNPTELPDVPDVPEVVIAPPPPMVQRQELPPRPGPGTGFIETNRGYALKPAQSRTAEVMLNAGLDPARVEEIVRGQRSLTQNEERAIIRNGPSRNEAELDAIEARRFLRSIRK